MKRIIISVCALMLAGASSAQTILDAVRYSYISNNSTARNYAVGGAMSALGGDFGTLSTNPAGLALYRGSEFTLTPAFTIRQTETELRAAEEGPMDGTRSQFFLGNIGLVLHSEPLSKKIRALNFGIGFNNTSSFNRDIEWRGTSGGSITDRWIELSNGRSLNELDDFEGLPAFNAGAIYDFENDLIYESDFTGLPVAFVDKGQVVDQSGSMSEFVLSTGININHKLMIGATLGIPFISFEEEKVYSEYDEPDEFEFFEFLQFTESLTTSGVGVNLKVGANYRVTQALRIGVYVHTPTRYSLTDNFNTEVTYRFDEGAGIRELSGSSVEATFDYRFSSPWVFGGGVGYLFKNKGFLSADIEYLDYSASSFNLNLNTNAGSIDEFEQELNGRVSRELTNGLNLRVGGELALDHLRVRAGLNARTQPYDNQDELDLSYRAGVGYRGDSFFIDFAYSYTDADEITQPYFGDAIPRQIVDSKVVQHLGMVTLGFRF